MAHRSSYTVPPPFAQFSYFQGMSILLTGTLPTEMGRLTKLTSTFMGEEHLYPYCVLVIASRAPPFVHHCRLSLPRTHFFMRSQFKKTSYLDRYRRSWGTSTRWHISYGELG